MTYYYEYDGEVEEYLEEYLADKLKRGQPVKMIVQDILRAARQKHAHEFSVKLRDLFLTEYVQQDHYH